MARAENGINGVKKDWNLTFSALPPEEAGEIDAFLTARAGHEHFYWTPPAPFDANGPLVFVCEEWEPTYAGGRIMGFTARFEQTFVAGS